MATDSSKNPIYSLMSRLRPAKKYNRSELLDLVRGTGVLMMIVFHFFYDLTLFGLAQIPLYTDFSWIAFRFIILSCFLTTTGAALYLHYQRGLNYRNYLRRIALISANALLITLMTYLVMRDAYIFFGILHLIALSSVLALAFLRLYWTNLFLGLAILWLGYNYQNPIFDSTGLQWIGMLSAPTGSADYTPIFPFFGLVLIGIFAARLLSSAIYTKRHKPSILSTGISWMGRHALIIYMIHQPILWGLIYTYISLSPQ